MRINHTLVMISSQIEEVALTCSTYSEDAVALRGWKQDRRGFKYLEVFVLCMLFQKSHFVAQNIKWFFWVASICFNLLFSWDVTFLEAQPGSAHRGQ
jgi:hypothetical protein